MVEDKDPIRDGKDAELDERSTVLTGRRSYLEATGGILGAAGFLTGRVASQSNPSNVLTVHGDRGYAEYEFAVSGDLQQSTDMGATLDDHDTVDGSTAAGHVWGGKDSYRFSGEITGFELEAPATVYLNGVEVDPSFLTSGLSDFLTIHGDRGYAEYEFAVSEDLQQSTDMGATLDDHDDLGGSSVSGHVWGGKDSYRFSGNVTDFAVTDGEATLYLNGEEVQPSELIDDSPQQVEFSIASSRESYTAYAIEVSATGGPVPVTDGVDERLSADENVTVTEQGDGRYLIEGEVKTPSDAQQAHGDTFRWETGADAWGVLGFSYSGATDSDLAIAINGDPVSPTELPDGQVDTEVNIGGGDGYLNTVSGSGATHIVSTGSELRQALSAASQGDVVSVSSDATISLSSTVTVPSGVTLASDRGIDGAPGGTIAMSGEWWPLLDVGTGARVTGLRIRGPHQQWISSYQESILTVGVDATGAADVEVDNCEISGFSWAGVRADGNAHVHHNEIHTCAMQGLGYGVVTGGGQPLIEYNYLDFTRHAVASTGAGGYTLRYNHIGPTTFSHVIDVHEPGGTTTEIHHNTVEALEYHPDTVEYSPGTTVLAVAIRGVPEDVAAIHDNWFYNPNPPGDTPGSWEAAILQTGVDQWTNVSFSGNHYGSTEPGLHVGHPR